MNRPPPPSNTAKVAGRLLGRNCTALPADGARMSRTVWVVEAVADGCRCYPVTVQDNGEVEIGVAVTSQGAVVLAGTELIPVSDSGQLRELPVDAQSH